MKSLVGVTHVFYAFRKARTFRVRPLEKKVLAHIHSTQAIYCVAQVKVNSENEVTLPGYPRLDAIKMAICLGVSILI